MYLNCAKALTTELQQVINVELTTLQMLYASEGRLMPLIIVLKDRCYCYMGTYTLHVVLIANAGGSQQRYQIAQVYPVHLFYQSGQTYQEYSFTLDITIYNKSNGYRILTIYVALLLLVWLLSIYLVIAIYSF